jgi:hypothetical protein
MTESKISKIQSWLENGNHISTILAIQMFDCMDLKSMIHKLRSNGIPIKSCTVGNLTTYFIEKENG